MSTVTPGKGLVPFYDVLLRVWLEGKDVKPRGLWSKEVVNFNYTLPPRVRFCCFDQRKLKLDYLKQEFLWYLRGDEKDVSIRKIAKMWDDLIKRDGSINSNYGQYIFKPVVSTGMSNFERVARELVKDPSSRRAAIAILGNHHLNEESRDYPCTAYINFHIRANKLIMYVRMRSQDAIFGMGNDAPCFSFTHELMWARLSQDMPGLELGEYHHTSDSMHIYERHYDMVQMIIEAPNCNNDFHVACPEMTPGSDQYAELRTIACNKVSQEPFDPKHPPYPVLPFTEWLLTRDDPSTLLPTEYA